MKLTILGSGGVNTIPRATCFCAVCEEARKKGIPYARTGCSLFLHDGNVLFDTSEDVRGQLNRERIKQVENVILTHWHPDHTLGLRVLEQINWNFAEGKPFQKAIPVYMSSQQLEWFKQYSCGAFLDFYVKRGMISIETIEHGKAMKFGSVIVTPYLIEHTKGFCFLIEDGGHKVLYIPCEYHNLIPDPEIKDVDILVVHNLFWENPNISPRKNPPVDEDSFETMLGHAKMFGAKHILLTHIEESFQLNHDQLNAKLKEYYPEVDVLAAYDGLLINL